MSVFTIEAKLSTGAGWWAMPYKFSTTADRAAFLKTLRAKNPNSTFREAP